MRREALECPPVIDGLRCHFEQFSELFVTAELVDYRTCRGEKFVHAAFYNPIILDLSSGA